MESQNGYIENEILLRVSQGDETAFRILFQHWHQRLATYVFRITESKEQTEEIVQDLFLKIWMTRETLSEKGAKRQGRKRRRKRTEESNRFSN